MFARYVRTTLAKAALCVGGAWLLFAVSKTILSIVVLCAVTICSYVLALWVAGDRAIRIRKVMDRGAVPFALISVVLLNVFGLIGTLTGSSPTIATSSPLLIAAPFYFLSAAAFLSDIAGRRLAMPGFLDYFTYVALPFKLLAGPLEPSGLIGRIKRLSVRLSWWRLSAAWPWLALGAFMKFVVANRLNPAANLDLIDPVSTFLTAAIFELKFYFDFAGYSFIGYGAALICGLRISRNFSHPFLASNPVVFWRRWHMSLGRFLTRYILEPNVVSLRGRTAKMVYASGIFLVSAMWHGGTGNYLLWGAFHGACYFLYIGWIKRWAVPKMVGITAMLLFFVCGRMLAIDADLPRLVQKLGGFIDLTALLEGFRHMSSYLTFLDGPELRALAVAAVFLSLEILSVSKYSSRRPYHLFRRPVSALVLLTTFVIFGDNNGALLYARI